MWFYLFILFYLRLWVRYRRVQGRKAGFGVMSGGRGAVGLRRKCVFFPRILESHIYIFFNWVF